MADFMALQPNLNIRAHIVAPEDRKNKVLDEIRRQFSRYWKKVHCLNLVHLFRMTQLMYKEEKSWNI